MAKQQYIPTSFWSDDWVDNLTAEEKLVYLYLLTNTAFKDSGIYKISLDDIEKEIKMSKNKIIDILSFFETEKKVFTYENFIIIPSLACKGAHI